MMEFLSNWIEGIAIAVIIASIFEIILPNGNLKKYIKIILGIYIIFNIISPFVDSNALYSFDLSKQIDDYYEKNMNKKTENMDLKAEDLNKIYKDTLEKEIKQTVEVQGYEVYSCKVDGIFEGENKDAGIKKIQIIISSKKIDMQEESNNNNIENKDKGFIENIQEIEKVEIGTSNENEKTNKITKKDVDSLKKYLSEHYELEKKIFDIQVR